VPRPGGVLDNCDYVPHSECDGGPAHMCPHCLAESDAAAWEAMTTEERVATFRPYRVRGSRVPIPHMGRGRQRERDRVSEG
jgi:hypothetical protein